MKHVLDGGAYWHNLVNTTEPSVCGVVAAFLSNHLFVREFASHCIMQASWCSAWQNLRGGGSVH